MTGKKKTAFKLIDQGLFEKLGHKQAFYLDLLQPSDEFEVLSHLQIQPFASGLFIPLVKNAEFMGLIQAFNVDFEAAKRSIPLLNTLSSTFSLVMANYETMRIQKIDNANLEAWRWELMQSRNTLRAMFDSIPTSIYIVDGKYKIVAINNSRSKRAEQKPSNLVGKTCYEVLYQRGQPCSGCRVNETFLSKLNTQRSDRQWLSNDQIIDWEITTYAILDESEYPAQVIIFEQDVTLEKTVGSQLDPI